MSSCIAWWKPRLVGEYCGRAHEIARAPGAGVLLGPSLPEALLRALAE